MKKARPRGNLVAIATFKVRPTHARKKQGVARASRDVVEQISGALRGVTRREQRYQLRRTEGNPVTVGNRSKWNTSAALSGKPKLDACPLGEQFRSREMIGGDGGVKHTQKPPSAFDKQPNVYIGVD